MRSPNVHKPPRVPEVSILLVLKEVMIGIEIYIDFKTEIFFTLMKNDPKKYFLGP